MTLSDLYSKLIELANKRNIFIVDDYEMPSNVGFQGLYVYVQDEDYIWINPSLPLAQKISTLAHELGHFKLHRGKPSSSILEASYWRDGSHHEAIELEADEYGRRLVRFLVFNRLREGKR